MIAAIDFAHSKVPIQDQMLAYKSFGQEDRFFIKTLLEMNSLGTDIAPISDIINLDLYFVGYCYFYFYLF